MLRNFVTMALLFFSLVSAQADSCAHIQDKIQHLACVKSAHKLKMKNQAKSNSVIDAAPSILSPNSGKAKGTVRKKPRVRLPHNRKTSAHRAGIQARQPAESPVNKKRVASVKAPSANGSSASIKMPAGVGSTAADISQDVSAAGLSVLNRDSAVLVNEEVDTAMSMPSRQAMLASDDDTIHNTGVGEAVLYTIY